MAEFKILKGGLNDYPTYSFIDAFVTDTRLMGVLGLRVHWLVTPPNPADIRNIKDIYHFYYYDLEELGLDSLKIFELADEDAVALATRSCFGGLGANMMRVSEKEARYLINYFIDDTIKKNEELPKALSLAKFVTEEKPVLTDAELSNLNYKMCTGIRTNYGVVNYYLMRSFGRDFEGAGFLISDSAKPEDLDLIALPTQATFLQNTIEDFINIDGSTSYLCESVVQSEDGYFMVTSEVKVAGKRITFAKKKSEFKISLEEASMILCRGEYVTVYKILADMEDFDVDFASFSIGTTRTEHESGDMYMDFNPNNDHVEESVFRLNADLHALYYITDEGELLIGTYNIDDMANVEERIQDSIVAVDTILIGRMQFPTEILYEFAQSGFGSFEEFLKTLHVE
ncbi:MAG: hypothetical protein Q4E99_01465 [Bacillota bacterium]|nr:hypothetical protein [Bacillota bacterium]